MKQLLSYTISKTSYSIKSPNRREKDEADIFVASKMGEFIRKGIVTKAMLLKEYADHGGVLTKEEVKKIEELKKRYVRLQNEKIKKELKSKKTVADKKRIEELESEMIDILSDLQEFELIHESVFRNTADNLARDHLVLWWMINLLYVKKNKEWVKVFTKDTYDENLDYFEEIEESKNANLKESCVKSLALISMWVTSKINSEEDFKEAYKLIDGSL